MNPNSVNSTFQSLAFGEAMKAAAEDYKKEIKESQRAAKQSQHTNLDIGEFADDPELQKIHADRLEQLKEELAKKTEKSEMLSRGHGRLTEISEAEFLDTVTKTEFTVCHFFHPDFQRCKIMDRHLESLAKKHLKTRFIKLNATESPFFTKKLNVRVLPCAIFFINGVAAGRIVGFDEFKAKDDFTTAELEEKLIECGVVKEAPLASTSQHGSHIRRGLMYGKLDSEDESSDFSDQ